jgi:alpha-D-ribose 1-methylphosphonate 5-triphosphate synthase subunit PhnG
MPDVQQIDSRRSAPTISARQTLMHVCAQATEAELATAITRLELALDAVDVRPPETGLVMLRGRIGGSGAPFNVGEATVTRAVVRLGTGETGISYMLGRSKTRARLAAILDAVSQNPAYGRSLEQHLILPVTRRVAEERRLVREETQATKVEFFTLVRGED